MIRLHLHDDDATALPEGGRAHRPALPLPPEVREAVERSAALPRGLALLHRAPPEVVAAALGVHPRAVDGARERLARGEGRRQLIALFAEAATRRRRELPPREGAAPRPPAPRDLVAEAERHPLGVDFLRSAHAESVAVTFGVHPDAVHRARELLSGDA